MPVIQGPVVVDTILAPNETAESRFNFGLIAATEWLSRLFSMPPLGGAVMLFVGLTLAQLLIMVGHQLTLSSGALKTLRDLRLDLFASLEHKPASFYDHVAVGRVMTRVTNDVENLFRLLREFVALAGQFVPFFFAMVMMLVYSAELTGIVLLIIPAAAVATYIFRVAMREIFRLVRDSMSALNQYLQEDLMGIEVVQLSGREEMNAQEYRVLNQENRNQEYRAINYEVVFETFNTSLTSIAITVIIWYGGGQVVQEEMTLGALLMFNMYINMMITPVSTFGHFFNTLFRAMASGERIFQAIDWDERLHEPEEPVRLPERLQGSVEFRNARFAYPASDPVLRDVSFAISPGEKLAVVGPTGAGKSTIIRLLARFYDFDDGMIFVDGIDVNHIGSGDLRKRVGVVLQDFHIFSGTVLENISLNDPYISRERAQWAARVVNADSFIRDLPEGLRNGTGRARPQPVAGAATVARVRARAGGGPGDSRAGRSDVEHRHGDRTHHPGRFAQADPWPHVHHHRPPSADHPRVRPDSGAGPGDDEGTGHPRRTDRQARHLLHVARVAVSGQRRGCRTGPSEEKGRRPSAMGRQQRRRR